MTNLLFVCEGNKGRSPTAEWLMSGENNYQVKSCGTRLHALSICTKSQFKWADTIFVMEDKQKRLKEIPKKKVKVLNVGDKTLGGWLACDQNLIKLIKKRLEEKGLRSSKPVGDEEWNMHCLRWFEKEKGHFLNPLEKEGLSMMLASGSRRKGN